MSLKTNKGFTIIELLVVITIFALIMAIALWNQRELSNNMLINNLAYEIALAIRETQAYGIGVRAQNNPSSSDFQKAFGIHVELTNPTQWVLFRDIDGDNAYDSNEVFQIYKFQNQNGNKITALCSAQPSGSPCTAIGSTARNSLDIMFKRPNPEAFFYVNGGTISTGPAYIVINTPANNNCRAVVVETTGQIHVESAKSPSPACSSNTGH